MSTEEVSVSLSRLALAKAIKTPDAGENEAEPWTKSIIFHQSHIDERMRHSILNPQQQTKRQNNPRSLQKQQHLVAPPMHRARSDELHLRHQQLHPPQPQQTKSYLAQRPPSQAASSSGGRSSLSSGKLVNSTSRNGRRFVPSDDEEDDDEDDDDDEEEEEEDDIKGKKKDNTTTNKPVLNHKITKSNDTNKAKTISRLPQPSDDEDDDDEDEDDDNESEDNTDIQEKQQETFARRMSTLRQLERGPSVHRRTRSTNDLMTVLPPPPPPVAAEVFIEPSTTNGPNKLGSIEQWRRTVLEAEKNNRMSHHGFLTPNTTNTTNTSVDELFTEEEEEEDMMVEEPLVSQSMTSLYSTKQQPRQFNSLPSRNRRSTMGELDMFYLQQQQQQQQQLYNMQLQQALQLQQAQQMVQMQQYHQQAMQLQQQQAIFNTNNNVAGLRTSFYDTRNHPNRKSASAMDLMLQIEQEKAATRKTNKKKMPNPSLAKLEDGLLSQVPEQGIHNINFQHHLMQQQQLSRASKSDYYLQPQQGNNKHRSRPPSSYGMMSHPANRRSQMIRSESSPIPTLSMSTPINPAYLIPPPQQQTQSVMMFPQQQQQMAMMNTSNNRSSQYLSNNKRQSTYSNFNQFI